MNISKVTVLTPNGRRPIVKVNPSTTVLQILEEVCEKHDFRSDSYSLKHHKRILDPSLMYRFTGLPNNCLLEMVESEKKRSDDAEVVLCLQLEDGSRLQGSFNPSDTFAHVLTTLCPDSFDRDKNSVIIYMRKELFGEELESTTLKSLGITSGRAMVRLIHKNPEELKSQANVYKPIVVAKESTESDIKDVQPEKKTKSGFSFDDIKAIKQSMKPGEGAREKQAMEEEKSGEMPSEKRPKWREDEELMDLCDVSAVQDEVPMLEEKIEEEIAIPEPQVIELGERSAVLFSLESYEQQNDEIPDSFFELTIQDVQLLLRDLKNQTSQLDDAPLTTSQFREMEANNRVLTKLSQYKKAIVRVQFPNRLVLQGAFTPVEKIQDIHDFVRKYLRDESSQFYLFTTPPKKVLPTDVTLIEADCVPTVLLHFGTDQMKLNEDILKPELLSKLTSASGATLAASKSRGLKNSTAAPSDHQPSTSKGAIPKQRKPDSFKQSSAVSQPSGHVPKWFKTTGK